LSIPTEIPQFSKLEAVRNPTQWAKQNSAIPFYALMTFTFVLYVTPQAIFPVFELLRLAMVSIVIAGVGYIVGALRTGKKVMPLDKETKLVLFLFLWSVISMPLGIYLTGSYEMLTHFVKVIILFLLISNIVVTPKRLKIMFWTVMICCFYIAHATIQNYLSGHFLPNSNRPFGPPGGIAENPNDMSLTVALAIPFALALFQISKGKIQKIICGAYILTASFAIICSLSRSGFLILAIISLMFIGKVFKKKAFKATLLALLCVTAISFVMPGAFSSRFNPLMEDGESLDSSSAERRDSALNAFIIMFENPLTGIGVGNNRLALVDKGMNWVGVHNVYLQYGAEIGIPGILVFLYLVIRSIRNMKDLQRRLGSWVGNQEIILLAHALEISIIAFAFGANFSPVAYRFHFYYLAAFSLALKRMVEATENQELYGGTSRV